MINRLSIKSLFRRNDSQTGIREERRIYQQPFNESNVQAFKWPGILVGGPAGV